MPPLNKHDIKIVIADDRKVKECNVGCGMDWSSAETITLAKQQIKDRFGYGMQLEYFDLSEGVSRQHALELQQKVKDKNLPLPLLIINGEPRISGRFDIRMLIDAIDAEMEIKPEERRRQK